MYRRYLDTVQAYFGLPDFNFAARSSLRLKVYCKLDPKAPEQFLVLITMLDGA